MKIILDNKHAKIWIDDEAPIIYTTLRIAPESSLQMQEFCDRFVKLVAEVAAMKKGAVYSVCDAYNLQPMTFDLLLNFFMGVMSKHVRAGLTYKGFVKPKSLKSLSELNALVQKLESLPIGIFDSLQQCTESVLADWKRLQATQVKPQVAIL